MIRCKFFQEHPGYYTGSYSGNNAPQEGCCGQNGILLFVG
ncbi:hypothetical protein GXM_00546 [Nostoc sphaeroides CCNUC1]|uniref:Uncharacterized protein n=1 Tax=Nostoc sphaeroides CCNUC1 TaxID=2653204 RepID=A0A5P8VRK3_9NOSO|nr:hypothetical protein GXM_00546 [Nostoc sphaeroides CCNUC1]